MTTTPSTAPVRRAAPIPRRPRRGPMPWLKPGIFLGGLVPLASLLWRGYGDRLGANPIAQGMNELGLTALVFLVAVMACTPARRLLGWTWQMRIRRELGLFAFFYASLHFFTYLVLDQVVDLNAVLEDIVKRPFITVGFGAFVLLIPVALTSTDGWVKRLGFRKWERIHQLVYISVVLAAVHFIWRVKIDLTQPLIYAGVFAVLLALRILWWTRKRSATPARSR